MRGSGPDAVAGAWALRAISSVHFSASFRNEFPQFFHSPSPEAALADRGDEREGLVVPEAREGVARERVAQFWMTRRRENRSGSVPAPRGRAHNARSFAEESMKIRASWFVSTALTCSIACGGGTTGAAGRRLSV